MAKVKIYSTPFCSHCKDAKEFFREHKIKFEDIDVSKDSDEAEYMIERTGQRGVPVIEVDGKIVIGFNEPELKKLLKIK